MKHEKYSSFPSSPSNPRRIKDRLSPRVVDPVKMLTGMQEICLGSETLHCKTNSQGMPSLLHLTLNSVWKGSAGKCPFRAGSKGLGFHDLKSNRTKGERIAVQNENRLLFEEWGGGSVQNEGKSEYTIL